MKDERHGDNATECTASQIHPSAPPLPSVTRNTAGRPCAVRGKPRRHAAEPGTSGRRRSGMAAAPIHSRHRSI